ncbi:MAG: hypothetical protein ACLPTZ_25425 [Beijerinckiaceae bacterium]
MIEQARLYRAVLAVCEKQDGLCMDIEEERARLAHAIVIALTKELSANTTAHA